MFKIDIPTENSTHNYAGHKISEIKIASTDSNGGRVTIPAKTSVDTISNISLAVLRGKVKPVYPKDGVLSLEYEKNDEITDLLFGKMIDEAPKEGIQKSDIYLADKSMINVSFDGNNSNPVSLTDVVDNFKKNFDVAYRKGKMYKRGSIRGF